MQGAGSAGLSREVPAKGPGRSRGGAGGSGGFGGIRGKKRLKTRRNQENVPGAVAGQA